jgi:hypothetical protein
VNTTRKCTTAGAPETLTAGVFAFAGDHLAGGNASSPAPSNSPVVRAFTAGVLPYSPGVSLTAGVFPFRRGYQVVVLAIWKTPGIHENFASGNINRRKNKKNSNFTVYTPEFIAYT